MEDAVSVNQFQELMSRLSASIYSLGLYLQDSRQLQSSRAWLMIIMEIVGKGSLDVS